MVDLSDVCNSGCSMGRIAWVPSGGGLGTREKTRGGGRGRESKRAGQGRAGRGRGGPYEEGGVQARTHAALEQSLISIRQAKTVDRDPLPQSAMVFVGTRHAARAVRCALCASAVATVAGSFAPSTPRPRTTAAERDILLPVLVYITALIVCQHFFFVLVLLLVHRRLGLSGLACIGCYAAPSSAAER